jgi:clan AA aspartic protease
MTGQVTDRPEALLPLHIRSGESELRVEAVLDSGFTDYLTLPQADIARLQLPLLDVVEGQLADGRIVHMEAYLGSVLWHGEPREIVILASDSAPLIGMSLLRGSHVSMEVKAEGNLSIEPLR